MTTEEYVRAFDCAPLQAGLVFAIDGRAVGLDLFDYPHTLRRLFPKLLRSYALDALETATTALRETASASIEDVLEGIATASVDLQVRRSHRMRGALRRCSGDEGARRNAARIQNRNAYGRQIVIGGDAASTRR
jgi:hypothetical protein